MREKIWKKIYYRIEFETASAMNIGNGENRYSDKDLIRDSTGCPFIPGSSLAGIYRTLLNAGDVKNYFGDVKKNTGDGNVESMESKVVVYDALLKNNAGSYWTTIRDGVGLDEWKTAKEGCKFDFEVVEPGTEFVTYIEQNCKMNDWDICSEIAEEWLNQRIFVGMKTMRGFGAMDQVVVHKREFLLEDKKQLTEWLNFDMYDDQCWKAATVIKKQDSNDFCSKRILIDLYLHQRGGISIRRYTTRIDESESQPDYEQLTFYQDETHTEVPFIPGSTWAGAFRHHMETLIPGCTGEYFGIVGNIKRKSLVSFSDSSIEHAKSKILTRNTIDRFTGGTISNALFTEKMWYGGTLKLHIEIPRNVTEQFLSALAASLVDLHMGILSVGGLTAVGRGIFEIEKICIDGGEGMEMNREKYSCILKALKGEK